MIGDALGARHLAEVEGDAAMPGNLIAHQSSAREETKRINCKRLVVMS